MKYITESGEFDKLEEEIADEYKKAKANNDVSRINHLGRIEIVRQMEVIV